MATAGHVIRLRRVVTLEHRQQLAQVGLSAHLLKSAWHWPLLSRLTDQRRMLAEQARIERDGVEGIHQHGRHRTSISRGPLLSIAHMPAAMPKAVSKDKHEDAARDTETGSTSTIALASRAPPEIMASETHTGNEGQEHLRGESHNET